MAATAKKPRRLRRWLLWTTAVIVVATVALALSLPFLLTHIPIPTLEFDLSPYIKGKTAELVASRKATANVRIERDSAEGFRIHAKGMLLDWPYSASAHIRFGFVRADGSLVLMLDGTDWKAYVDFGVRSARDWHFTASVPETHIDQDDALLAPIVSKAMPPAVSNLVFTGRFSLNAGGDCTPRRPVPAWTARGTLADVDVNLDVGGKPSRIDGLKVRFGADGIADHRDIAPLFPRANAVEFAGFTLSNVFASVRATEKSYLVTEAGAKCCGGELKLYSLFLDPKSLNLGATIFIDGVDAGEALSRVSAFHGDASGRLHGKLPFFLKDGKTLRLRDAHLFSTPGEIGKMRIVDARPILENLEVAGVPEADRTNLSKVLADLDYDVLKVELKRGKEGEESALELKIEGSATRGNTTVPVNLDVTFHGDFDQLIDTGLKIRRKTR